MSDASYVLGHEEREMKRLVAQAEFYRPLTEAMLNGAGIGPGMRVLDVGCGAGDVSLLLAERVGPDGEVVGIDRSEEPVKWARERAADAGLDHVRFEVEAMQRYAPEHPFDAVVGRLVLMYQPDPLEALRSVTRHLAPGGVAAFQELQLDATAVSHPRVPLLHQLWSWVLPACEKAGIATDLGMRLVSMLHEVGLEQADALSGARLGTTPDSGATLIAVETTRSLAPLIVKLGIASAEELDVDTLEARLSAEIAERRAVITPSLLVSAWARKP